MGDQVVRRALALLALLAACSNGDQPDKAPRPGVRGEGEARRIRLERILITYRGNPFDLPARRSIDEAARLAKQVLRRARAGENFVALRNGYSDDRKPGSRTAAGPYFFRNYGVDPYPTSRNIARMFRVQMGRRLGDVAFALRAGEIALVEYDEKDYPAGYEVIKVLARDDRSEEQVARDLSAARRAASGGR